LPLHRRLDSLYLQPILALIKRNKGHVYPYKTQMLQLMIDIKTEAVATLNQLIDLLKQYPDLIQCSTLQIAISGNRSDPATFTSYPAFIHFDGELNKTYSTEALSRIVMMSDNLKRYTKWNGEGAMPAADSAAVKKIIDEAHALNKPVRFWDAPDSPKAWRQLMHLQVDYINTDSIKALSEFLMGKR